MNWLKRQIEKILAWLNEHVDVDDDPRDRLR